MKIGIMTDLGRFVTSGSSTFQVVKGPAQGHSHNHTSSQPTVTVNPVSSPKDPYAKDDDDFEVTEWKPEEEQDREHRPPPTGPGRPTGGMSHTSHRGRHRGPLDEPGLEWHGIGSRNPKDPDPDAAPGRSRRPRGEASFKAEACL